MDLRWRATLQRPQFEMKVGGNPRFQFAVSSGRCPSPSTSFLRLDSFFGECHGQFSCFSLTTLAPLPSVAHMLGMLFYRCHIRKVPVPAFCDSVDSSAGGWGESGWQMLADAGRCWQMLAVVRVTTVTTTNFGEGGLPLLEEGVPTVKT